VGSKGSASRCNLLGLRLVAKAHKEQVLLGLSRDKQPPMPNRRHGSRRRREMQSSGVQLLLDIRAFDLSGRKVEID